MSYICDLFSVGTGEQHAVNMYFLKVQSITVLETKLSCKL
jgi:hypothetical protein